VKWRVSHLIVAVLLPNSRSNRDGLLLQGDLDGVVPASSRQADFWPFCSIGKQFASECMRSCLLWPLRPAGDSECLTAAERDAHRSDA
jgi:hypothetical protein